MAFGVLVLLAAAIGIGYQRPLLIALSEAGLIGILLLFLYGSAASRGIQIVRHVNARVVEEDEVVVQVFVRSGTRLPMYAIQVSDGFSPEDESEKRLLVESISPRRPSEAVYVGRCNRGRGLYEIGPLVVTSADPLGFFIRERRFEEPSHVLVLPRTLPVHHLELGGLRTDVGAAAENNTLAGGSPLFFGTREYRPGDNIRHLHWRSYARWGRLAIKEFEAVSNREVSIFLDLDRDTAKGVLGQQNVELAIHLAASLAEFSAQHSLPVQLLAQGSREVHVPMGTGAAQLSVMMETLATVSADGSIPYTEMILSRLPIFPEGSTAVFIINSLDADPNAISTCAAAITRRQGRVLAIIIDDGRYVRFRPRDGDTAEKLMRRLEDGLAQAGAAVIPIRPSMSLQKIFSPEYEVRA